MKSFASLASTIGSYIFISDKPDENSNLDINGPLFEKLNSKFEALEADPMLV